MHVRVQGPLKPGLMMTLAAPPLPYSMRQQMRKCIDPKPPMQTQPRRLSCMCMWRALWSRS